MKRVIRLLFVPLFILQFFVFFGTTRATEGLFPSSYTVSPGGSVKMYIYESDGSVITNVGEIPAYRIANGSASGQYPNDSDISGSTILVGYVGLDRIEITPNDGYSIDNVTVGSHSLGSISSYDFMGPGTPSFLGQSFSVSFKSSTSAPTTPAPTTTPDATPTTDTTSTTTSETTTSAETTTVDASSPRTTKTSTKTSASTDSATPAASDTTTSQADAATPVAALATTPTEAATNSAQPVAKNAGMVNVLKSMWMLVLFQLVAQLYAVFDLFKIKSGTTRNLTAGAWTVIIFLGMIVGPIAYLLVGRSRE